MQEYEGHGRKSHHYSRTLNVPSRESQVLVRDRTRDESEKTLSGKRFILMTVYSRGWRRRRWGGWEMEANYRTFQAT